MLSPRFNFKPRCRMGPYGADETKATTHPAGGEVTNLLHRCVSDFVLRIKAVSDLQHRDSGE